MYQIKSKEILNSTVTKMTFHAPLIAKKALPGQFIILRIDEKGERVPFTISDTDAENGNISVIFQILGLSTTRLNELSEGDFVTDIVGPLGKPTELSGYKKVCIVAGGLGCAIAYPQAKYLYENGVDVDIIAGFRNKDIIILEEEMKKTSNNLYITTDDGSYGVKGLVTDILQNLILNRNEYDLVITVGPLPMMKFVSLLTKEYGIKTIVSMNTIMIDGTGMCGGCRLTVGGETKFACVDGPDFDGHLVDFDEAIRRNKIFSDFEKKSLNEHKCKIRGTENVY